MKSVSIFHWYRIKATNLLSVLYFICISIYHFVFLFLRHYLYEQKLAKLLWKIEYKDILLVDSPEEALSQARPIKVSNITLGIWYGKKHIIICTKFDI